jgi:hypothetical protein
MAVAVDLTGPFAADGSMAVAVVGDTEAVGDTDDVVVVPLAEIAVVAVLARRSTSVR